MAESQLATIRIPQTAIDPQQYHRTQLNRRLFDDRSQLFGFELSWPLGLAMYAENPPAGSLEFAAESNWFGDQVVRGSVSEDNPNSIDFVAYGDRPPSFGQCSPQISEIQRGQ